MHLPMAFEATRYERLYAKLLLLYPRAFREQVGEGMQQTFGDLCLERRRAGVGLFGFAIGTYADTALGIIKENILHMTPERKHKLLVSAVMLFAIVVIAF